MAAVRSLRFKLLLVVAVIVFLLAATHSLWMAGLGNLLVRAGKPVPADIAVVLGGDFYGHRIVTGAELVRQGYVPKVLVSGAPAVYGLHECDLAIQFAVNKGYPKQWFVPFRLEVHSTQDEARLILPELRRLQVQRFLLVTTDYHSARAARVFEALDQGLEMHVVAAPDEFFHADSWWTNREARKTFLMEWAKTVSSAIGL